VFFTQTQTEKEFLQKKFYTKKKKKNTENKYTINIDERRQQIKR